MLLISKAQGVSLLCATILLAAAFAQAEVLLDEKCEFGPGPDSRIMHYVFKANDPQKPIGVIAWRDYWKGNVHLKVAGPADKVYIEEQTGPGQGVNSAVVEPLGASDVVRVEIDAKEAIGKSHIVAVEMPDKSFFKIYLTTGPAMIVVGLAFLIGWRRLTRVQWRWFWVGAGIWTIAVAIKVGWALELHQSVLSWLERTLSHQSYLLAGAVYIGAQSSLCEIGVTFILALFGRRASKNAYEAAAIGFGAGIFEAVLLGLGGLISIVVILKGWPAADTLTISNVYIAASTPVSWLAGPVERILAILCHASTRTLIFAGVATRRWRPVALGFLLFAGLDGVAGLAYLGDLIGTVSMWWVELAVAPFAAVSIPILSWCFRMWPETIPSGETVLAEESGEQAGAES